MRKRLFLTMALAVLAYATACSTDDPETGDLCRASDYPHKTKCSGSQLMTCENGILLVVPCADKCVTNNNVAACLGSSTACGEVPARGLCEGNISKRCFDGKLIVEDCARDNKVCEKLKDSAVQCVKKTSTDDCGGISQLGVCKGNMVQRCIDKLLVETSCGSKQSCVPASGAEEAYCKDNDPVTGCGDVTEKGVCNGKTLKYCLNGQIKTESCSKACVVWKVDSSANCAEPCPSNYPDFGTCVGESLEYCEVATDGKSYLNKVDCTVTSKPICGFDSENAYYNCIKESGCRGYPAHGICVGNALWSCKANKIVESTCVRETCMNVRFTSFGENHVYGYCTAPCVDVTEKGVCSGNLVKYCKDERLHVDNCDIDSSLCDVKDGLAYCKYRE